MKTYTSGELAERVGVNAETIRYYERRALLTPSGRRRSGYRIYTDDDVARLRFIRSAKALGFTLREIQQLLNLTDDPTTRCTDVKALAIAKLAEINQRIAELTAIKTQLQSQVALDCPDDLHPTRCPSGSKLVQFMP
jgi:Hg(II)-responsive transcriptional regulator